MSEKTTVEQRRIVLDTASTITQKSKFTISPVEPDRNVERICKAFIRLITAPESEEDHAEIPTSTESSTTRV